ncbi:zinc-binding protein A33-like [Engraulis encrasicolus]|uniref:zinc-binding protein A33-like n=1 Tax=Engraulis encrasicolus TaxID=184585 RepID=UPI002FD43F16
MAAQPLPEDDLSCPVCCDIFKEPVVLSCSHSFCDGCLKTYWQDNIQRLCPVCRNASSTDKPPLNLALRNLCLAFRQVSVKRKTSVEYKLCPRHGDQLKLFCLEDKRPVCVDCLTAEHRNHNFCTTQEAAQSYKDILRGAVKPLHNRVAAMKKKKETWEQSGQLCTSQAKAAEERIKEEFSQLHSFLQMEEALLLDELREEQQRKEESIRSKIDEITQAITEISQTTSHIEQEMEVDDLSFLQNFQETEKRSKSSVKDPEDLPEALINTAKYVGNLKYNVWRKILDTLNYTPILLDPNTAHPMLKVSEQLTTLSVSGNQTLPDNAERFDTYLQVLGAEGYASGKHAWEVEVGRNPSWILGVARESLKRKGTVSPLGPASGIWCIWHKDGGYVAVTQPETPLLVKKKPHRVRVELDMERGDVTFTDQALKTTLHKFRCRFTERMFPLLSTGNDPPLRVSSQKISVLKE